MADEQNKPGLTTLIVVLIGFVVCIWAMGAWFGFW